MRHPCMGGPWLSHASPMGHSWATHGTPMGHPWEAPWATHRRLMGDPINGKPMGNDPRVSTVSTYSKTLEDP